MRLIGLTGGIASGKSVVARRLAEHGAVVIDADAVAREVVEPGEPALEQIRERFGDAVIAADGRLDRPALGAIVFADEASRLALNDITHPAVWRRTRQRMAEAERHDAEAVVVYDVPLLVEGKSARQHDFAAVVVVEASREERIRRMAELRGMSREDAVARISAQATDDERRAIADHVIDANGSLESTLAAVDALWPLISAR